MDKITTRHLSRLAYVYIRQSTLGQLQHNTESRRVQERLLERAQSLGWHRPRLIDEDLGCSVHVSNRRLIPADTPHWSTSAQGNSLTHPEVLLQPYMFFLPE
jgi:hypothetical protein